VWDTATLDRVGEPFDRTAFVAQGVLLVGDDVLAGDEQGRLLEAPIDGSAPPTASASRSATSKAAWNPTNCWPVTADSGGKSNHDSRRRHWRNPHSTGRLQHRRQDDDTACFVQKVLGNIVGHIQNFVDDGASIL
jgi:hypothetical protein